MGIIARQSIKQTTFAYIGVALAFVTNALIFPKFLLADEIGLLRLLVSFSMLFASFAGLGFTSATNRMFPYFRDTETKNHGFLSIAFSVTLIGTVISIIVFMLFRGTIIENNIDRSALFVDYLYYVIPLIIVTVFFNILDVYNRLLYDAVLGTFLKEFLQRVLIFSSIILYILDFLTFRQFVIAYLVALSLPTVIILVYLIRRKQFSLKPEPGFITKDLGRSLSSISFWGLLTTFSGVAFTTVDSIMVNALTDIGQTGIYFTTFVFGTIVIIPGRSVLKISTTLIADAWKENDLKMIFNVYYKSCLNLLIIGSLIFIGIWGNIHNILNILPDNYSIGKYVIFFAALGFLINMGAMTSGVIISTSRYYKIITFVSIAGLLLFLGFSYLLIPRFGIAGAALSIALAKVFNSVIMFIFIKVKFGLQPYNYKFLLVLVFAGVSYLVASLIPVLNNLILDIIVRSFIMIVIFSLLIIVFRISEDMTMLFNKIFRRPFRK